MGKVVRTFCPFTPQKADVCCTATCFYFQYGITFYFHEHFIFALIREPARFAKKVLGPRKINVCEN